MIYSMLMYSQLAVGISGTIFIRVSWGPAVESLLHPAVWYQKTEKENIPEEMLCACHLSRTVAALKSLPWHALCRVYLTLKGLNT